MEMLTDILAIAGWALFGTFIVPPLYKGFTPDEIMAGTFIGALAFGLITASLVLG